MCGVVSALAYGEFETNREEKTRQESIIFLVSELLQLTQSRGKDATGIATMFSNCDYMGLKMGVSAQEFVGRFGGTEQDYDGYLDVWRKKKHPAKIVIGHCRKPSVRGNAGADDNKNNHPIKVGDIIGVHNGTLDNHENIFKNLNCTPESDVDSEAIFQLLHHFTDNGTKPFTTESILETCKRIGGTYSCLTFSGNNPYQMAAFRDGRPLEACIIRPLKLLLIASDKDFLKAAVFRYNKMAYLYQTGAIKFIPLKKDDIDLEILKDDCMYLFDVQDEITPKTQIKDLYISEKVPRGDKIWKKSGVSTSIWHHSNQNCNTVVKKTTVTISKPNTQSGTPGKESTTGDNKTKRLGMVWNRSNYQYESIHDVDKADKHGGTEIDIDSGEVIDISNNIVIQEGEKKIDKSILQGEEGITHPLEESDTPVDNLISDPAKINEIAVSQIEEIQNKTNSSDTTTNFGNNNNIKKKPILLDYVKSHKKVEIDASTYPDVVEKAQKAVKEESNFSNDNELADAIEVTNVNAMKHMATYSLANRVKAFFFRKGWYAGYIARMKEEYNTVIGNDYSRKMLIRSRNKALSAQKTIKMMKIMVKIYDNIAEQYFLTPTYGNTFGNQQANIIQDCKINRAVTEIFDKNEHIRPNTMLNLFSEGDMKNSSFLKRITSAISHKCSD